MQDKLCGLIEGNEKLVLKIERPMQPYVQIIEGVRLILNIIESVA